MLWLLLSLHFLIFNLHFCFVLNVCVCTCVYAHLFVSGDWFVWAKSVLFVFQHAHVSMAEVIGLLGGRYSEADKIVEVSSLL